MMNVPELQTPVEVERERAEMLSAVAALSALIDTFETRVKASALAPRRTVKLIGDLKNAVAAFRDNVGRTADAVLERMTAAAAEAEAATNDAYDRMARACARKTRYSTPAAAGRGAASAHAKGSTDELRVYPCIVCDGYHLTHLSLAEAVATIPKGV